jgi:hypothetical protein
VAVDCTLPTLAPGRWLVFGGPPPVAGLNPYGEQPRQAVRTWRSDHPATSQCQFGDLVVGRAAAIAPDSAWTPLVEGSKGPLIVAGRADGVTMVYAAFSPMDSNWPFQRSFVNFNAQAIQFLAALGSAVAGESLEPGAMLRTRVPRGATDVAVAPPGGGRVPVQPLDGEVAFGPLRTAGVYEVEHAGAGGKRSSRSFAVNLTDPAECAVAAAEQLSVAGGEVQPTSMGLSTMAAWPLVVLAALVLIMVEWWIHHRSGVPR